MLTFATSTRGFASLPAYTCRIRADYYAVLSVSRRATPDEIRTAYRALARAYHPDVIGAPDDDRFKLIAEAYSVLGDPRRRTIYDAQLIARERESGPGQGWSHVSV